MQRSLLLTDNLPDAASLVAALSSPASAGVFDEGRGLAPSGAVARADGPAPH